MKKIILCFWAILCFHGLAGEKILKYNPDTVRSFSGTIVKVEAQHWYGKKENLLFVVAPEKNAPAILVDGGLSELYKKKPVAGDRIRITGSFVKTNEREVVLSRSVLINGRTIQVRMENGVPFWIWRQNKEKLRRGRNSFIYRRMRRGRH